MTYIEYRMLVDDATTRTGEPEAMVAMMALVKFRPDVADPIRMGTVSVIDPTAPGGDLQRFYDHVAARWTVS